MNARDFLMSYVVFGGSGGGGYPEPQGTKEISITENGIVSEDVKDYAEAEITVAVPQPSGIKEISITENGVVLEDVRDYEAAEITVNVQPVSPERDVLLATINNNAGPVASYEIPSTITVIRASSCRDLKVQAISGPGVLTVETMAFQNTVLQSLSLPVCTELKESAVRNATALTSANLPLVRNVANHNFRGCTNLTSLSLPRLENVGTYVFNECSAITSIVVPLLADVKDNCFCKLSALQALSLPGCTNIRNAFSDNSALMNLFLPGARVVTLASASAFNNTPLKAAAGNIWVHDDYYEEYLTSTNWSSFNPGVIQPISNYSGSFDYNAQS